MKKKYEPEPLAAGSRSQAEISLMTPPQNLPPDGNQQNFECH